MVKDCKSTSWEYSARGISRKLHGLNIVLYHQAETYASGRILPPTTSITLGQKKYLFLVAVRITFKRPHGIFFSAESDFTLSPKNFPN